MTPHRPHCRHLGIAFVAVLLALLATGEASACANGSTRSIIGAAVPRIDGPLKTSGTAMYAADHHFPNLAHAVPVQSTIASGSIRRIDTAAAEKMPGVLLVLHHGNADKLYRVVPNDFSATASEARPPFEDTNVYYFGQYVAVVIAETLEQATARSDVAASISQPALDSARSRMGLGSSPDSKHVSMSPIWGDQIMPGTGHTVSPSGKIATENSDRAGGAFPRFYRPSPGSVRRRPDS